MYIFYVTHTGVQQVYVHVQVCTHMPGQSKVTLVARILCALPMLVALLVNNPMEVNSCWLAKGRFFMCADYFMMAAV